MLTHSIVIVGSGFAGLGMAIRLKKAGIEDFTLLEKAQDVGGTWCVNRYPGAACDIPSPVYSFSFELSHTWSRKFAPQGEIFQYLRTCADKYDIRKHIRFGALVDCAEFDEASGMWLISFNGGERIRSRFLILCTGGLSRPAYPKIEGIKDFRGMIFHTAEWRQDFSLEAKKVAVIGTGASAIQVVPAIAGQVSQLKLFQRTPAWILPKDDYVFSPHLQRRFKSWPLYAQLFRLGLYWQFEIRGIALLKPKLMKRGERIALDYMRAEVKDQEVQAKLIPNYTMGCKRILLSNDFYQSLNIQHVQLISEGIRKISPTGIVTQDGQEHAVDAIVCATGFQVAEASAPFKIIGREGKQLGDIWRERAEAFLGTSVHGFPNMFFIIGPNTGLGHNSIVFIIESQIKYILSGLKGILQKKVKSVEVKAEVQEKFNTRLQGQFKNTVWSTGRCMSWYTNAAGRNTTLWPGFSFSFRLRTLRFDWKHYQIAHFGKDDPQNV